ncbi:hypothetical protein ACIQXA_01590 [Streptomyces massasporeus]|uniref:hypothetical protein n=1 Tax=Streptomyces massasporeus TaxID=67324 RepID=UPI00381239F5
MELHLRGPVEPDPPGTVRARVADAVEAVDAVRPPSPLAAAVHACLRAPAAPKASVKDPGIRLAVAVVRIPLAEAGLLRYPLLGATRSTRRHVRDLRHGYPLPTSRHGLSDHERLLLVALTVRRPCDCWCRASPCGRVWSAGPRWAARPASRTRRAVRAAGAAPSSPAAGVVEAGAASEVAGALRGAGNA